ncbi:FAD-dependent oxidoreductase [Oceanivirga miroungae]|uniref:Pyridine nucleotide-disulfide oxidoreductase dimerization protein n=1 Tax=Oceanivirga miroungae TaxID=1130046 RepID=A0A6I8M5A2_9FUSO|nr:FAD-dependent oxidoreductase [Oceanivirga miroungae]VWL85098.1 pyridine nucleotide-disulfide oxidoreductase dimerization protein [Oceanivirga miroungae]
MNKIVVIGGGAAGMMFSTQHIRKNKEDSVIVFEKGEYVAWAGCPTPYYISSSLDFGAVVSRTVESFTSKGIDVRVNTEIVSVNKDEKYVVTDKNEKVYYDKLVIAVGAKPNFKLDNAYTLSNPSDAKKIKEKIEDRSTKKALIVGGGFIGIELAESFIEKGLDVSLVEANSELFPIISKNTKDILYDRIKESGLKCYLAKKVTSFNDNYVILDDDTKIDFDILVLATGVKPNIDFISQIVETKDGKIVVDKHFNTSVKDIYAIGDSVYNINRMGGEYIYQPQGDIANKHGYLLAANKEFKGTNRSFASSYFEIKVAGTGYSLEEAKKLGYNAKLVEMTGATKNSHFKEAKENKVEVVVDVDNNLILGAFSVGYDAVAQFIDQFSILISQKVKIDELINIDFCYSPTNSTVWNPVLVLYRKVVK